jgi:TctA family transporter
LRQIRSHQAEELVSVVVLDEVYLLVGLGIAVEAVLQLVWVIVADVVAVFVVDESLQQSKRMILLVAECSSGSGQVVLTPHQHLVSGDEVEVWLQGLRMHEALLRR